MAIYAPTTNITGLGANAFNKLYSYNFIPAIVDRNAFLYMALGKSFMGSDGLPSFERLVRDFNGPNIEGRFLGSLDTISTVSQGTNEVASDSGTYNADHFGNTFFPWTHYYQNKKIPSTDYNRIRGDEAKTKNYVQDVMQAITLSMENTLGTAVNAAVAGATETVCGNWQHAVSDGVSTGETGYATYGFDRSDSANSWARGINTVTTLQLTVPKIRTVKNGIAGNNGFAKVGIAGTTVYGIVQALADQYTWVESDPDWMDFTGEYVGIGKTRFMLDQRATSGVLGLFTPETWTAYQRMINFTESGIVRNFATAASYVLPWDMFFQVICWDPGKNGKLTGITG